MSVGGLVGAIVGGVVGFFIGGPLGVLYGTVVGFSMGMMVDPMEADIESVGEPSRPADKLSVTPNDIGAPIYDLLGTGSIKGNLLFYGRERSKPIYSESSGGGGKGGGGSSPPKQITGYKYYMSWGVGICIGEVDEFYTILNDDIDVWSGNLTTVSGGQETIVIEGMGSATISFGTQDQMPIDNVGKIIPDSTLNTPYRGLCWIYFDDCYIGNNRRMPSMRFVIRKTPELSFNNNHLVESHTYNPMHAIWYVLNNLTGLPVSWLNETTFSGVADTLNIENRGVSILFSRQQKAISYIESINSHIDGIVLYKNDGEFHPKLIRDDYGSPTTTIDEDVLLEEPTFNRGSWIDTINEVKVMYSELLGVDIYYTLEGAGTDSYALGIDDAGPAHNFRVLDFIGIVNRVSCGFKSTMVVKNDGTLWATGYNNYGQLGLGYTSPSPYWVSEFTQVGTDTDWEFVSCAFSHTIAIKKNKTIWGTGDNYWGQLGLGDTTNRNEFTQIVADLHNSYSKISTGPNQSLFLTTTGRLYGAGSGLKLGTSGDKHTITLLSEDRWKDIFGNDQSSILINNDGTLWQTNWSSIYLLDSSKDWDKLPPESSSDNYFAIKDDGTLWAKGQNNEYSLGLGHSSPVGTFTQVGTDTDWAEIRVGERHSIAIKSDGSMWGVGNNTYGQLGISNSDPKQVFTQSDDKETIWLDATAGNFITIAVKYQYNPKEDDFIDFRQSTASPIAVDEGNIAVQDRTVTKSIKMALFTTNKNAVWGGRTALQKVNYPYAQINVTVNRNLFRLEVGDCFYFSYDPYSVDDMICRVIKIEEKDLNSENITITAIEDVFGITRSREDYTEPESNTQQIPDTSINPFYNEMILESPYVLTESSTQLIPIAGRRSLLDLGFYLYMSVDGGNSYSLLDAFSSLMPHGTLVGEYSDDVYTIDNSDTGFTVDFDFTEDLNQFETTTFSNVLASMSNAAIIGDEIISIQTITPDVDNKYILTDVIRGRFGTEKETHTYGSEFYFINLDIMKVLHSEIVPNATRYFKLVPYNNVATGDIAESAAIGISITGKSKTPYKPTNFMANDGSYAARYVDDVVLTWSPRYRGKGAGIGIPGEVLPETDREGYFRIEVWVSSVNVRDITNIDSDTYTYTEAENLSDNGSLASSIEFRLYNFREESGTTFETEAVIVVCKKEL